MSLGKVQVPKSMFIKRVCAEKSTVCIVITAGWIKVKENSKKAVCLPFFLTSPCALKMHKVMSLVFQTIASETERSELLAACR